MPPEQHLQHAVDDILEAVWPRERHRAMVRLGTSILGRTAVFVSALLVLSFAVYLVFGLVMPWTFFVFMTALTLVCAAGEEQRRSSRARHRKKPREQALDRVLSP